MSRRLTLIWALLLAAIAGFGWYKSSENQRDLAAHTAWRAKTDRLRPIERAEYQRLRDWLKSLNGEPNARQRAAEELNGGQPLTTRSEGDRDVFSWRHAELGIELEIKFRGDRKVGHSARSGTDMLLALHPEPPWPSRYSRAETWRQFIVTWMPYAWLLACLVAALSRRLRPVTAQAMLALALLCGTAWLTAPHYSLTLRGIFSNDPLFFAALMLVSSIVATARVAAAKMVEHDQRLRPRFRLRTLLVLTAVIAVCLAMGPFGYVALGVLAVGGALFLATLRYYANAFSTWQSFS